MTGVRTTAVRAFIAAMSLAASLSLFYGFAHWHSSDTVKFGAYLLAALFASSLKVTLPGIEGNLSVNFLFTLLGILELSLPETLCIGLASTLAQFYWRPVRRPKPVQLLFNLSQVTVSSAVAYAAYRLMVLKVLHGPGHLALLVAAITHFACNTAAMSTIIGLTEGKAISKVWTDSYLWSFPYYMVGAATAGLVHFLNKHIGWQSSLLVLPPIYLMYRSYRLYLGKLESEKKHAEQVSNLHLRTIEALALAIEAKDQTTGEHLQRVRIYAMELARELGLTEDETEALRAASVLHDIGKLAVPEHIISKPGKLTPDEFEKMKIHPIVGAKIVEVLQRRYIELEQLAREQPLQAPPKLSTDIRVERGLAPAAGFAESAQPAHTSGRGKDAGALIASARQQAQALCELSKASSVSFALEDILSLLAVRVKHLVPHDSLVVYLPKSNVLVPELVSGENFRLFSSLRIPLGEGLSGWVAENHKPILNGNPSVEPGYLNDPTKYSILRSALAVPIEAEGKVVSVSALYRAGQDAFTGDDLSLLEAIVAGLGAAFEIASKPKASVAVAN